MRDRFCVCVVQADGGEALLPVKRPRQDGSSGCAVHIKGGQGHWNCADTTRDELLILLNMIRL